MSNPLDKMADNAKELGLDYEPATYTFKPTSEPMIAVFDMKPNYNMTFHNQDGKQVGELNFNGPEMVLTGDADESAKVLFDFIAYAFKARLEQERAEEREACAKVCEQESKERGGVAAGPFVTDFGKHTYMSMAAGAENCVAAIRARGNT